MPSFNIVHDTLENESALFIGGSFIAGWQLFDLEETTQAKIEAMLECAYNEGKQARSEEIKQLLTTRNIDL